MRRIRSMSHSAAVVITAALIAELFAGGSALAVNFLTKHDAKQLFYTKKKADKRFLKTEDADKFVKQNDADNKYVRTASAGSATGGGTGVDLGPNYLDL